MKNIFAFLLLLSLCTRSYSAAQSDEGDFLQSEVTGSFNVPRETDNQLPMSERINLLFIASYYSRTDAITRFIEAGVPADSTNSAGMTTLIWAAKGTRYAYAEVVPAVNYLILHGAKVEAKDKSGKTAADYAFEYGRYNLLPILDVSGKYRSFYEGGAKGGIQDQLIQTVGDLAVESMSCGGNLPPESEKIKTISNFLKAGQTPTKKFFW
jgi:hypothetical protein